MTASILLIGMRLSAKFFDVCTSALMAKEPFRAHWSSGAQAISANQTAISTFEMVKDDKATIETEFQTVDDSFAGLRKINRGYK